MLQREVDRTQPEMKTLRDTCENLNAKLGLSEQLTEKYKYGYSLQVHLYKVHAKQGCIYVANWYPIFARIMLSISQNLGFCTKLSLIEDNIVCFDEK